MSILPSHWAPQETLVIVPTASIGGGSRMVIVTVVSQPFASDIVHVYGPAHNCDTLLVPSPCGLPGCQSNDNVPTPPEGLTMAVPSHKPLQVTSVCVSFGTIGGGAVIVNCTVVSQPAMSVMVTLHTPGHSCEAAFVLCPTGGT